MFTGIIEGQGTVEGIRAAGTGKRLSVASDFPLEGSKTGDSIAVNGACLTAVRIHGRRFEVDVSPETLQRTTLGACAVGKRVNIERALRLSDRLDGHIVTGHVDGTARLEHRSVEGNAVVMTFQVEAALARYLVEKGSVAVDGISLTVNRCGENGFDVSVIPHTAEITTLGTCRAGERVNIETDIIGKYVERLLQGGAAGHPERRPDARTIDRAFLSRAGYL